MSKETAVGRISLWAQESDGGSPVLKGNIEIGDRKLRVSIWKNDNSTPNAPEYTGEIENEYVKPTEEK